MGSDVTREIHSELTRQCGKRLALERALKAMLERDEEAGRRRHGDRDGDPSRWPAWTDNFFACADPE
jgi:hypothetical protein